MKKLFLAVIIALYATQGLAQDIKPVDSVYIVTYTTGSSWNASKPPYEQTYFKEHSANLNNLRKEGVITAGARYADKGIIFIRAASMEKARELIFADIAVVNKLFQADIQKLSVFYEGCIEKPRKKE